MYAFAFFVFYKCIHPCNEHCNKLKNKLQIEKRQPGNKSKQSVDDIIELCATHLMDQVLGVVIVDVAQVEAA